MANGTDVSCKTKGCNNPILTGKFCLQCTQVKKEKGIKRNAAFASIGIATFGVMAKSGVHKKVGKQLLKVAEVVVKSAFKG